MKLQMVNDNLRRNKIEISLKALYLAKNKDISETKLKVKAETLAFKLKFIPQEFIRDLFLWLDDNFDKIPDDREIKKSWFSHKELIKGFFYREFNVEPDLRGSIVKPMETGVLEKLALKYPAFGSEIGESMRGDTSIPDLELLSRIMKKLEIHAMRGPFGQWTRRELDAMDTTELEIVQEEENNIGAF